MASSFEYVSPGPRTPDFSAPVEGEAWMRPPEGAVARSSTAPAILAGNDQVLVAVTATRFEDGVDFQLTAILAPGVTPPAPELVVCDDFLPPETLPDGFLRFGVVDINGAVATNLPGQRWVAQLTAPPETAVLTSRGHGFGGNLLAAGWWHWSHPRSGELVLVAEWPTFAIPETRITLRADGTWRDADPDEPDIIAAWTARAERSRTTGRSWTPQYEPAQVVAEAITRARNAAGVSTFELARRLGISKQELEAIENAEVQIDELEAFRIGDTLGTGLHYLYPGFRLKD